MPAGQGKRCQDCYYGELLKKRIAMDCAAIAAKPIADLFQQFGDWLGGAVGVHRAAITVHRYLGFFLELERQWKDVPAYSELLAHFGAEGLRRTELPMRFLDQTGIIAIDQEAKLEDSERRRIESIMNRAVSGSREREVLEAYRVWLQERVKSGASTLRSMRLALSPAAGLLLYARGNAERLLGQNELEGFLKRSPGQRAALSGFVGFLRQSREVQIALPAMDARAAKLRRKKLETEMLTLMREGGEGDEFRRHWLSVALAYFHGLPKGVGRHVPVEQVRAHDKGGLVLAWGGRNYWIPGAPP